jgi:hypothetical protein
LQGKQPHQPGKQYFGEYISILSFNYCFCAIR